MSVVSVKQTAGQAGQDCRPIQLPVSIQNKLHSVIRQNRRAELVRSVALFAALGLVLLIGLIATDLVFGLRWTPIRWVVWITALCTSAAVVWCCLAKSRRQSERLLEAAWRIETAHPRMEERLTSTIQFVEDESSQTRVSPQLLRALVSETSAGFHSIDEQTIPKRSACLPMSVAASLATFLLIATALWPQSILTSLANLATPWSAYKVPTLSIKVSPGNVTIAQGETVEIEALAAFSLVYPTLEIVRGDVVESHAMRVTSPESCAFQLNEVMEDASYRISSGGLYSSPYNITVHPQPRLRGVSGRLTFPEYTHLNPLAIEEVIGPIEVPSGTEVTLRALSDTLAIEGAIRRQAKQESRELIATKVTNKAATASSQFEWEFKVEPEMDLVGMLEVLSQHGVRSEPHPIRVRALEDVAPSVEISAPQLRQLTMRRAGEMPIRYRVIEDFGIAEADLMVEFGEEDPIAYPCQVPEREAKDQQAWNGATRLELSEVPAGIQKVALWLRVADNRPEEYGGSQVVESEAIQILLDDRADSLGQQQILANRQMIEQQLDKAIEQMQAAKEAAQAFQDADDDRSQGSAPVETAASEEKEAEKQRESEQQDEAGVRSGPVSELSELGSPRSGDDRRLAQDANKANARLPMAAQDADFGPTKSKDPIDSIETLREQTQLAKKTLDELAKRIQDGSTLFQTKAKEIRQVSDQEVTEALELANQIPLADDQQQQSELAHGSQQQLTAAIEQLDRLKSDIEQQAQQMEQAAQLDQLASEQERLAREVTAGDPQAPPEQEWRDRQEEVAEDLQALVEEYAQLQDQGDQIAPDERPLQPEEREKLLRQAEQAEQLAHQAQQLAEQQQQLAEVMAKVGKQEGQAEEAKQQLDELIEAQKQETERPASEVGKSKGNKAAPADKNVQQRQRQRLKEAAKASQEGDLDQAASKVQEQIAERAEQIQQQAEQLANQDHADRPTQQRVKQATKELKQAKEQAEQAEQTLCEKCIGGESSEPTSQNKRSNQQEQVAQEQNAKPQDPQRIQPQQKKAPGKESGRQEQGEGEFGQIKQEQQDAAQAFQQAAQSLKQVCESCRECANCDKPGASVGSHSGSKPKVGKDGSTQSSGSRQSASSNGSSSSRADPLAKASDGAKQAAQSSSKEKAGPKAQDVSEQLSQLADQAAQESGYLLREQRETPQERSQQPGTAKQPGAKPSQRSQTPRDPEGVGRAEGAPELSGQKLRGGSSSNWTRSRRKLGEGVLDDREGNVPERYRAVVERYFEELSRQQSDSKEG